MGDGHLAFPEGVVEGSFTLVVGDEDGFLEIFFCELVLFEFEKAQASHVVELIDMRHLRACCYLVYSFIEYY